MPETGTDAPQGATDPTPDATDTTMTSATPETVDQPDTGDDGTDWKAELEKWKAQARKHEQRAKENATAAKQLEELRRQTMSEQERAVAEAQDQGYKRALLELGSQLVDAEIRAASAGRLDDKALNVLLQGLNRSVFLGEDGQVDQKSVREFVDGIAPPKPEPKVPGFPDLGQGARSAAPPLNGDPLLRDLKQKLGIA